MLGAMSCAPAIMPAGGLWCPERLCPLRASPGRTRADAEQKSLVVTAEPSVLFAAQAAARRTGSAAEN